MDSFKIAAAQVPSIRGAIDHNMEIHATAIAAAAGNQVNVLIFPELSLIGYEPEMAAGLAILPSDPRLCGLQEMAQRYKMYVGVGAPLVNSAAKPALGTIIFCPDGSRQTYEKMHLGGSEPEHFAAGKSHHIFAAGRQMIGVSICADSSEPSHPRHCASAGATIYAASVFLNAEWYASDAPRLSAFAPRHQMLVLMANQAASNGTLASAGKSAAWAPDGALLAQAPGPEPALVIASHGTGSWSAEVREL
jgi:predicted amidohydrolase